MKSTSKRLLALLITLCLCFSMFACDTSSSKDDDKDNDDSSQGAEKETITDATAFVTVDINPSVEITIDEDGTVASIYGANEDGQILLYEETENLVGINYEAAVEYITNLAVELGYLDKKTGSISTSVTADNADFAAELQNKIGAKIKSVATAGGITVEIDTSDPFSLLCELEELKAKYPDNVKIQEITPSDYRLALTLSEREDISIVAAVEYDNAEIIKKINAAHGTLESYATDAYLAAKKQATRIFNTSMGIILDGVYNEIYLSNISSHLNTYYYGAVYQAYKTTARTYSSIYEIKLFADSMANYEIDDATVTAIATELGIEDTSAMKNAEGKITVESLIEFCDNFIKTNEVSDEVKAHIQEIIADARVAAELTNKGTTTAYAADIQALSAKITAIIASIEQTSQTAQLFMSASAKEEFNACITDLSAVKDKIAEIISGGITESEVEALAAEAEAKASEMLTKIKADLSEEELVLAETKIENLKNTQATLTQEFEARLSAAEAEAKAHIESKRAERKNAK